MLRKFKRTVLHLIFFKECIKVTADDAESCFINRKGVESWAGLGLKLGVGLGARSGLVGPSFTAYILCHIIVC